MTRGKKTEEGRMQCACVEGLISYCLNNAPTAKSKILAAEVVVLNFLVTVSSAMSPKIRPISESTSRQVQVPRHTSWKCHKSQVNLLCKRYRFLESETFVF
jgi:hypothetical protein